MNTNDIKNEELGLTIAYLIDAMLSEVKATHAAYNQTEWAAFHLDNCLGYTHSAYAHFINYMAL